MCRIISYFLRSGRSTEEEIRTLSRGDYFGEQSLLKEDKRSANIIAMSPGVECLTLDREAFKQHIGDLEELHEKDYGDRDRIYAIRQIENRQIRMVEHERQIERGKGRWVYFVIPKGLCTNDVMSQTNYFKKLL